MNEKLKYLRITALMLLSAVVVLFITRIPDFSVAGILDTVKSSPALAAVVILGIYCVKTVIWVIPLIALYIGTGLLFPPVPAILITLTGLFAELTLGYAIGRRLDTDSLRERIEKSKYVKQVIGHVTKNDILGYFLIRFIPLPADLTNMFMGAIGAPYSRFALGSMLGLIPGALPPVLMGSAAADPLSPEFLIPFGAGVVINLCALIVYRKLKKDRVSDSSDSSDNNIIPEATNNRFVE
ncbi:MAG: VTT domain-containing protein [Eubacteriales bacterium]|jgi:uncharacterized membrane protein YdjX (TVP38/TMEM64 family)|nr:VTT domain-containing protein [Eubacteriales bacterium]